ncbi:hypothetical protein L208DRAFT_1416959 [Tricholoma matsutake]|nr:hypothetical protein L208DRAFT_1416959 [Tricholoma matsutake 945]
MEGLKEELAIQEYLNKIQPGLQGSFSVQCWAQLWLPNGQFDRCDYFAEVQYSCHP